jgi:hypothetical protein
MISGGQASIEVQKYSTVRVRATGATVVTIAGVLSATMSSGEIMIFSAGIGDVSDSKKTVTVSITGADAYVQVAKMTEAASVAG